MFVGMKSVTLASNEFHDAVSDFNLTLLWGRVRIGTPQRQFEAPHSVNFNGIYLQHENFWPRGKIKESLPINSPCESPYFYYCHLLLPTRFCVEI